MKIIYKNKKDEKVCKNFSKAKTNYGEIIAKKLISLINYIEAAEHMRDIISMPIYNFHKYQNEDVFSLDIGGRKSNKRLLVELMDINAKRFKPCDIDRICDDVKCIFIIGVRNHDDNKRI